MQEHVTFSAGPLYALLHEACYANASATEWAAQRVRAEFGEFNAMAALDGDGPLLFTGEMIYPWMIENDPVLAPLAETAEILARHVWAPLYGAGPRGGQGGAAAAAVRRGPAAGQ